MPSCGAIRDIVGVIVGIGSMWNGSRGNNFASIFYKRAAAVGVSLFRVDSLVD